MDKFEYIIQIIINCLILSILLWLWDAPTWAIVGFCYLISVMIINFYNNEITVHIYMSKDYEGTIIKVVYDKAARVKYNHEKGLPLDD